MPPAVTPAPSPAAGAPPNWVDDRHPIGRLIKALLAVEPLRQLMFLQARRLIIRTAERRGIAWRLRRQQLQRQAEPLLAASGCPATVTPPYYRARFHAYGEGNLCWAAACEAEQATDAMALRVWPGETLSPQQAQGRLRQAIFAAIEPSLAGRAVHDALDLGCSVGVGTLALKRWLEQRQEDPVRVSGLDLSPHMLAVARVRDGRGEIHAWHHAAAEVTGLPEASLDLITLQFVCHELPATATAAVLEEAARLLRPGGVIALVDQDPDSAVIRRLPAPIATLLKSTEPYLEDYFRLDLPEALRQAGFRAVRSQACDPRHRVLVACR
ncbi:class I SAM-dependent methyltransferase [Cyanobium sp. NIES-981]|uniref:class I SAM-dependent methyltransferase n=1 Tax=Cyanobium sp. NIES-981 TaxID=1851505 RepID=UPI0007DE0396|nr:class I SAM-dependent methyltransferase [Cyanobium sp. NIES-981]SBO41740.1 Methyltransferase type 11 [Cyanobium sp. NIES-981]